MDSLLDNIQKSVLQINTKYKSLDLTRLVKNPHFSKIVHLVSLDFTTAYDEKGFAKYEHFQLKLFTAITEYLYKSGTKQETVKLLFSDEVGSLIINNVFLQYTTLFAMCYIKK